jgi:DNA-binding LacI/PurR family transcriptional regulator
LYNASVNDQHGNGAGRGPSYRDIASVLARDIEEGVIPAGAFLPTEKDLQTRFRASRTTVRRALAKLAEDNIAENLPNRGMVARKNGRSASKTIAFINGHSVVLRQIYARLSSAFLEQGIHLIHVDSQSLGLENSLHFAMERGFDGAFIWSFQGYAEDDVLARAKATMPIVVLDHVVPGLDVDIVTLDYFRMAREVTEHLARVGRKRVAVSGMLDMLDVTHSRFSGYMIGLFESGMQPHAKDFAFCCTSGEGRSDSFLFEARLKSKDRPDAVFVLQDEFVLPVVEAILRNGFRIPEDVALATIGDDVQVSVGGLGVTAAHCEWDEFTDLALGAMLDRMSGYSGPSRRLVASHKLVVRGTCGSHMEGRHEAEGSLVSVRHG